jgi:hypothetical protein
MAEDEEQAEPVEAFVVAPPPPKSPTSKSPLWIVLGVFGGLIVGFIIGVAVSSDSGDGQASPSTTKPGQVSSNTSRSTVPSTTTTTASYTPVPADFQIGIVETSRSCFGTAGCSIDYRIDVTYIGAQAMKTGAAYTVVYDVLGGESVKTDNFEITGSQYTAGEGFISTPPNPILTATATKVLPN